MPNLSRPLSATLTAAFDLTGRIAVITGGGGLLGGPHAETIAELGGTPVLFDIEGPSTAARAAALRRDFGVPAAALCVDITDAAAVARATQDVLVRFGRLDILINNAAHDAKVGANGLASAARLEQMTIDRWTGDLAVGLTGAFLCSQAIGAEMARRRTGVILNIASDLALIAPDQRLYRQSGLPDDEQPVKPVTYSVVKAGLVGLTRYLATYWADRGVRANALSPGGIRTNQDEEFVARLSRLVPLGRMARLDEYKAAVAFLVSDASSYMTGANLVIDGGRTAW